jgi:hypothetical protein
MISSISDLPKLLSASDFVFIDEINEIYRMDLIAFISGHTLMQHPSGRIAIPKKYYKEWLKKIYYKGFSIKVPYLIEEK